MVKTRNKTILFIFLLLLIIILLGIFWIVKLQIAHSTFDHYYNFDNCVQLINKTDTYGFCKTSSGYTIKIVKYDNKWFLDGDLPVSCGIITCP